MYNIMNNSISGMSANQGKIDIISNNIANSQTAGYKKLDVGFLDLYTDTLSRQSYPHNKDSCTDRKMVPVCQNLQPACPDVRRYCIEEDREFRPYHSLQPISALIRQAVRRP